jgi:prolyl 4-hydroxylase
MIYLNTTEAGGGTHFTAIDTILYPQAGRAVIWNNLYADGSPNPDTIHHGMPVERGTKVIITKWFRDKGVGSMFTAESN